MCDGRERGNEDENMRVRKADRLFFSFQVPLLSSLLHCKLSGNSTALRQQPAETPSGVGEIWLGFNRVGE